MKLLFLSISLFAAPAAFSDTIYAYEGGELLEKVFEVISQILYGDAEKGLEKTFNALLRISLAFGAFSALLLAFFRQKFEPLIRNFFIPSLIVVGFLLIPRTSVQMDKRENKSIEVPFFLGKLASWTSYSFHSLHGLFENAIGKDRYSWTTKIYNDENFFRRASLDPKLEKNLSAFCRECVFHDLGLGLYSKTELEKETDLVGFLTRKTSNQRAVAYDDELISCREAIAKLQETPAFNSLEPNDHPSLDPEADLASQKAVIDLLQKEIFGPDQTKRSFGTKGGIVLMSLRPFFEAVLYLIFPLVVLLSLLSFGLRTALLWIRGLIWVSIWPIFYLSIDLFLDAIWKSRTAEWAFNLKNAAPFADLYTTMEMVACAALFCIPILSWLLIKGGFSQFIHIASLPAQEATRREAGMETAHPPQPQEPGDVPRQAAWESLPQEVKVSEDSFKENIESSKLEDRVHALHRSLSAIREAVKETKEIKPAVESETPIQAPHLQPELKGKDWGGSRMHIPSHGSWSDSEKMKNADPT